MTVVALAPEVALAWLRSLSVDLRAAVVLDAGGAVLAGDEALAARVAAVGSAPAAAGVAVLEDGDLLGVRSARHTVAAVVGPHALRRLAVADLRAALGALDRR
ncbi:MAG: hypothetical protein QOD81_542 [Solirubrobacteraceae bacterium]|jgi:hypothetical protein|nr:hypothetical protein [Solirubrobacteraceae bacterium]